MYKKLLLIFAFSFSLLGIALTITSKSWVSMWLGLELNMLAFLPLVLIISPGPSASASLKYLMIQAPASFIILQSSLCLNWQPNFFNHLILSALALKIALAPFYAWLPAISLDLDWISTIILLSAQKLAPFFMISLVAKKCLILSFFFIMMSAWTGALGGLNETLFRKILAFSSIAHSAWLLLAALGPMNLWLWYYTLYILILVLTIIPLKYFNLTSLTQLNKNTNHPQIIMISFLSMGGLPPLVGFLPKWVVLYSMMFQYPVILSYLLFWSVVTLYFYIRASINFSLTPSTFYPPELFKFPLFQLLPLLVNLLTLPLYSLMWGFYSLCI